MSASKYLQCLCDICDNVKSLLAAIRSSAAKSLINIPLDLSNEVETTKATVCSLRSFSCIDRKCSLCGVGKINDLLQQWIQDDDRVKLSYTKWSKVTEYINGKEICRIRKVVASGARWELANELCNQLRSFPYHLYNCISQSSAFTKCKASLKPGQVVVVADFAENYVCRQFAEAQSAYYCRNSVTIHPFVLIFPSTATVRRDSLVIISNDLKHDAYAVQHFMTVLGSHLQSLYPEVTDIIMWSDGCAAQYKSKLPMHNIAQSYNIPFNITWNFFGSRHGKGEADGESAVVKGKLDRLVRAQHLIINDASDAFKLLRDSGDVEIPSGHSQRHLFYVPHHEIDRTPTDICGVPGVRRLHQAKQGSNSSLVYRRSSCYCVESDCQHDATNLWTSFIYPG